MSANKRPNSFQQITQFLLIFAIVYIVSQLVLNYVFPDRTEQSANFPAIALEMVDDSLSQGQAPELRIANNTQQPLLLPAQCPEPPFTFEKLVNGNWQTYSQASTPICDVQLNPAVVEAEQTDVYSLAPWKYAYFGEPGEYRVTLSAQDQELSITFRVKEVGTITALFRTFITRPLLNSLVFVASLLPNHSLGWSIVVVTLLIKLLLFFPTNSALKGQRKLQAIQPKIDALRKKHKNDPQALNRATMELWKREKVNPFQSCLPLLIQFPVLLGLFFVVRDGSILEFSSHLLYSFFTDIPWSFTTQFLGLDLTEPNVYVLPVMLVALQFIQLKLSFAKSAKNTKKDVIDVTPKDQKKKGDIDPVSAAEMQKKVMLYVLPLMIGFFAMQFPAAVAVYWAVSTIFAIGQQLIVNKDG